MTTVRSLTALATAAAALTGCRPASSNPTPAPVSDSASPPPTFAQELEFLRRHGPVQLLQAPGGEGEGEGEGRVAVSAQYQGRVMTSAVAPDAPALGWINREFIEAGRTGTQFDNYGGEDRFWLGPEGGQFALYFPAGAKFEFARWQVPAVLNEGAWPIRSQTDTSVTFVQPMRVTNYSGTTFELDVERTVRLLPAGEVATHLGVPVPEAVRWVGFETVNRVTNTGSERWTKERGLPSIWTLGMFEPFGTTYVVIPLDTSGGPPVVNDAYFGKVPADRLSVRDGYLLFKADGDFRSKIGVGPAHATPVAGSYNDQARLLTIVQFTMPAGATDYVNRMWEQQREPYGGDVINSYNDGSPGPGLPPLGGFYELETSSPALALAPGESFTHTHRTLHFTGDPAALDGIARAVLGVPVQTIAAGTR